MIKLKNQKGFTLIELMVVVVIIGILAAMAIGRYSNVSTKGKQAEPKGILKQIYALERAYVQEFDHYWPSDGSTVKADSSEANRNNLSMLSIHVEVMATARYTYEITGFERSFIATATATGLDSDDTRDIWQIDDLGNLVCILDDSAD